MIQIRTDTVTVTKEVEKPLPTGDTTTICLGNGMPVTVRVSGTDTLIGDARVKLKDARPVLDWSGAYANPAPDTIRIEKRLYKRQGLPEKHECDEFKQVGAYNGVAVFAPVDASNNLPRLLLPVHPGLFQNYGAERPIRRK